jgi:glycosyltransferase involved in cell wall biosynthesis
VFAQSYSSGRFDVLLLLARALRIPLVAYHAGGRPEAYLGVRVRTRTLRRADLLIVSSREELTLLETRYGIEGDRLALILTPIDTEVFRPRPRAEACAEAQLDPARRYLLFVGRLQNSAKRVDALLHAFTTVAAAHPDVDLLIAGSGPDADELRRRAPDRARFLGWISDEARLACLYNSAECLVLPSWREGFPTVIGEALACGTPVISSRGGGAEELVVPGQTGWLIPPGDDEALAVALVSALEQPERLAAMRPHAREAAERRVAPAVVAEQLRRAFARLDGATR